MLGHKARPTTFIATLLAGLALLGLIRFGKPAPETPAPLAETLPVVQVMEIKPQTHRLWIASQGVVEPALKTTLVAQVSGRVEQVSEQFANGGAFAAGQSLVQIEAADYEIALSQARASLADARRALAIEKGQARQAKREWRNLGSQEANDLFLRKPQLASATANVSAAEAGLRKAELDLQRTKISAPYDGIVLEKAVDVGRFVAAGTRLGEVFADDRAEVRLPVSMLERSRLGDGLGTPVVLYSNDSGTRFEWEGEVARVEAALDTASRQHYLVAAVDDAFRGQAAEEEGAATSLPLMAGQFVQARIAGREADDALRIPRRALRQPSQVWLLDNEDRLQIRDVDVLQRDTAEAVVTLDDRESNALFNRGKLRLVVSDLSLAVSGLQVRPLPGPEAAQPEPATRLPALTAEIPSETSSVSENAGES